MGWLEDKVGAFLTKVAEKQEMNKVDQEKHELTTIAFRCTGMAEDSITNLKALVAAYEQQTAVLVQNQTHLNNAIDEATQERKQMIEEIKRLETKVPL